MPRFSANSLDELEGACNELQQLFELVVAEYDCTIIQSHRGKEEQTEAYRTGRSKTPWPDSRHNELPSEAVDVAPYPIDWTDTNRFYHFAGYVLGMAHRMGYRVRWGGDWDEDITYSGSADQNFMDLVHFEYLGRL